MAGRSKTIFLFRPQSLPRLQHTRGRQAAQTFDKETATARWRCDGYIYRAARRRVEHSRGQQAVVARTLTGATGVPRCAAGRRTPPQAAKISSDVETGSLSSTLTAWFDDLSARRAAPQRAECSVI